MFLRTTEEQAQEKAYLYEPKSCKPGVDTKARWVRKENRYRYGYKKHVLTDNHGLVEALITTSANYSVRLCYPIWLRRWICLKGLTCSPTRGYCSKKNSHYLTSRELIDGIMHKASREKKRTNTERSLNKIIRSSEPLTVFACGSQAGDIASEV